MMQLDLFNNIISGAQSSNSEDIKISWSYSKMQSFRDCPRKYYYSYYGSKKTKAKSEPIKQKLIELSKLSNKYMVQGNLIHQLISIYFRQAKKGEVWDLKRLQNFGTMIINETFTHNDNVKNGLAELNPKFPKPILKELFYSRIPIDELRSEMTKTLNSCLNNFFESDQYNHLRYGGTKPSSKIEGDTSFNLTENILVDGKVDIAFLENKQLIIADWKTGKKEFEDTSLQLLVYSLWAKQLTEWEFESIQIQKAYLATGNLEKLDFSELHISRARARIMQDAELIKEMHEYGSDAVSDAFTKHVGKNCEQCPFEEICINEK